MIGDDIPLTSDIIPKNGEWIGRTVDNKPELFEVCDGFYYLFGGRLVRYINARRSKKEAMVDYFVVFIASDGTSEKLKRRWSVPRFHESDN